MQLYAFDILAMTCGRLPLHLRKANLEHFSLWQKCRPMHPIKCELCTVSPQAFT